MKKITRYGFNILTTLIFTLSLTAVEINAIEGQMGGPFGWYCMDYGRSGYGARSAVKTPQEAREIIGHYFSGDNNLIVVEIKERCGFYEAEIRDKKDTVIDIVILDKRTGRIRSIR